MQIHDIDLVCAQGGQGRQHTSRDVGGAVGARQPASDLCRDGEVRGDGEGAEEGLAGPGGTHRVGARGIDVRDMMATQCGEDGICGTGRVKFGLRGAFTEGSGAKNDERMSGEGRHRWWGVCTRQNGR